MPNTTTLLSEYVPERSRSTLLALMFTGFNLGSALVGFLTESDRFKIFEGNARRVYPRLDAALNKKGFLA